IERRASRAVCRRLPAAGERCDHRGPGSRACAVRQRRRRRPLTSGSRARLRGAAELAPLRVYRQHRRSPGVRGRPPSRPRDGLLALSPVDGSRTASDDCRRRVGSDVGRAPRALRSARGARLQDHERPNPRGRGARDLRAVRLAHGLGSLLVVAVIACSAARLHGPVLETDRGMIVDSKRRQLLAGLAAGSAILPLLPSAGSAQQGQVERDWSGNTPLRYPDPDIVVLEPRFRRYVLFNTPLQRIYTGTLWAEGPAWNGVGRYLVWSDIPNNRQLRFIDDDSRVTTFRAPSGYSNGNTFDFSGRQISCEHGGRRVVRYEADGSVTVLADSFNGKRLNSPNDAVVHPDGSIWFTDPIYGISGNYEGFRAESELDTAVYRIDGDSGRVELVTDEVVQPNGLCFSPDYSLLYVADTGARETKVWDVAGTALRNGRQFVRLEQPVGGPAAADGIRCDADGNIWAGAAPGVQVIAPDGTPIGLIRLPEICANVAFGGARRNRLFMAASQSLYAIYVGVAGAHIC